jgi:hypothetical protein
MFCKKEGKWTNVQVFFFLRDHPEWLSKCRLDTQTMITLCKKKKPQTPLRNQKTHLMLHELPLCPLLTQPPHTADIIPKDSTPPVDSWSGQGSCSF